MEYWLTTRWPAEPNVISAAPAATLGGVKTPTGPEPGDRILICRFQPEWEVLPDQRPADIPMTDQWPRPEGMVVVALVIEPPATNAKRRPLTIGRDPNCWIRILDMRLPNYDEFDPAPEIMTAVGLGDDQRRGAARAALAGLIRLTEEQFNRLLLTFSQRQQSS